MKSLRNNTLVMAVAMTLWATTSMAGEVLKLSVGSSEIDTHRAAVASSTTSFHALSRVDAQTLAEQEMTDQELRSVEGGMTLVEAFVKGFESGKSTPPWGSNGNVILGSCVSCQGM
jgi:hypothetical protein